MALPHRPVRPTTTSTGGRPAARTRLASVAVLAAGAIAAAVLQTGAPAGAPAPRAPAVAPRAVGLTAAALGRVGASRRAAEPAGTSTVPPHQNPTPYYEVSPTGAVWPLGGAPSYGHLAAAALDTTVVAVTMTTDGRGYWLVTASGRVENYGDAAWYGSPFHSKLGMTPVGLVADPDGDGYWIYGEGGRVAGFGAAAYHGGLPPGSPIVGMVATADAGGYWLVAANGSVTPFGDARWHGGEGHDPLASPIVGMAASRDGQGYWLVSAAGDVYPEGDAAHEGSLAGVSLNQPIASILPTTDGLGYWLVSHDGDLHPFGDAADSTPPVTAFVHTVVTAGDKAVEWAMAQLGKPYKYGGTGPGSFDCSGLTMEAWLAAGVAIPRVANDQYEYDTHVAMGNLVDGDLLFWASTSKWGSIYHVGMYLGGGHMVNAPHTGTVVQSDWVWTTQLWREAAAP